MAETENENEEVQTAEEAPAESATEDAGTPDAPEAAAPDAPDAAPDAPQEQLSPKERRIRARSRHTGDAQPERSPEERASERADLRRSRAEQRRRWRARAKTRTGPAAEPPAAIERVSGNARIRQGVVVSDKADKTITVRIDTQRAHRTYGKIIRNSSTLHAHDEGNEAGTGDTVRVVESRPLSKTKRWRLVEVVERAR